MDVATQRVPSTGLPWRQLGVLALIAILIAAAAAAYVGSQPRLPEPFGTAGNGLIIYADAGDLFSRSSLTGAASPLVAGIGVDREPVVSPDGSRVAFIRSEGGSDYLMAATVDGSAVGRIYPDPVWITALAWSPDSATVAVVNEARGIPRLLLARADGRAATPVELGAIVPTQVAWRPPDGRELLVRGMTDHGSVGLYLVPSTGGPPRALIDGAPIGPFGWGQLDGATWSPDGSLIAYTALATTSDGTILRTHVLRGDGTGEQVLPGPGATSIQEGWPAFSPDGLTVAVHRWRWEDDGWLSVYDRTGSVWSGRDIGPVIAANGGNVDLIKTWSPDGERIIARTTNTEQIFAIDPVTGSHDTLGWHATSLPTWQRVAP